MKTKSLVIAACMTIFGLGSSLAIAGAETSGKQPFAFNVVTCNETVSLSGWFRTTTKFHEDGAGGTHFISHLVAHGTGMGLLTGTHYVWNDSFEHLAINETNGAVFAGNLIRRTNLISKGNLENSKAWITAHLTITPDDTAIVDRFDLSFECF